MKNLLVILMTLAIVLCFGLEGYGEGNTSGVAKNLKIQAYLDGELAEIWLVASFFYMGEYAQWSHTLIHSKEETQSLLLNVSRFSTADKNLQHFLKHSDKAIEFDLEHYDGLRMHVIGKRVNDSEWKITGTGLQYLKSLDRTFKIEWKSVDEIKLPYNTIK